MNTFYYSNGPDLFNIVWEPGMQKLPEPAEEITPAAFQVATLMSVHPLKAIGWGQVYLSPEDFRSSRTLVYSQGAYLLAWEYLGAAGRYAEDFVQDVGFVLEHWYRLKDSQWLSGMTEHPGYLLKHDGAYVVSYFRLGCQHPGAVTTSSGPPGRAFDHVSTCPDCGWLSFFNSSG